MPDNLRDESTNWVCSEWVRAEEKHRRALQALGEAKATMAECRDVLVCRLNKALADAVVAPDGTVFLADGDDFPGFTAIKPLNPWQLDDLLKTPPTGEPEEPETPAGRSLDEPDDTDAEYVNQLVNDAAKSWGAAS
jgi:hypothetical protein